MAVDPAPAAGSPAGAAAGPDRAHLRALLRAHGAEAMAFAALKPGIAAFIAAAGAVGYRAVGRTWVAVAGPVAAASDRPALAQAFVAAAAAAGARACFFCAEGGWPAAAGLICLPLGAQPVWDPRAWAQVLGRRPGIGRQLARARSHGVVVAAVARGPDGAPSAGPDAPAGAATGPGLEAAIAALVVRWQRRQALAPMAFVLRPTPLADSPDRQLWLAWRRRPGAAPELVGLASAVPIPARRGRLVEDLVRLPAAPNGTAELLIDAAMRAAAAEGCQVVTLGLVALAGPLPRWLRLGRWLGAGLYGFAGLRRFRAKLMPAAWEPVYLALPRPAGPLRAALAGPRAVLATLRALTPRGLGRFGWDTLGRGPPLLYAALAVTLVPWTAALAAADGPAWFGHAGLKWAWVGFDVGLIVAFARLARGAGGRTLLPALAVAVSCDATLTAAEIWAVPAPPVAGAAWVRALAVAGPALAAVSLWRAWRHARRADPPRAAPGRAPPPPSHTAASGRSSARAGPGARPRAPRGSR